ncbi:hypothetical protein BDZ94DRAFT_1255662 [Collybia nuda]|uniref:Uncharacterized protein n=1 Tax=Collybia nuda TaxID=64659 RepID=A0A9P6CLE5_9AGAR|nr:hypothetical protein BDZ94DRAFT_1255662 [Collybia nuda]
MRGFQNQSISEGTPNSKPYFSNIDHLGNIPKVLINYKSSLVATENKNIGVRDQAPEPDVFSRKASVDYKARAIQVVGIFRQLANLSNQVTQETEVQTREERKVELYTELSSTLSNISAIGAASIMPNLADMALKNAERKQRIDVHFKSIAQLWEQAFEIFAVEISRVLNNELEKSVKEICQAADLVGSSLVVSHSPPSVGDGRGGSSIQKGLAGKEEEPTFARNEHISQQEHKRRRYAPPSPVPNETPIMGQQPVREEIQQSVQEILSQMKLKIDEQTQSLQMLMKENYELKTSLQGQMSTSLQSSNYSSHSSHGLSKGGMTPTVSPDQP